MRILIFHGYLLHGTGSNVYNARLAEALVRAGHEVHLLCQDRDPLELDWVDATADWDGGTLAVRERREPVRATVYRPDIGGLLPVYVADRYDGVEARPFHELSEDEVETYVARNVDAVRDVVARARPDVALANHLVMGPAVLARALAGTGVPYAVKIHGSALEYTVKPYPRFMGWAREGLAGASGVLVGSKHTGDSLSATMADPAVDALIRLGPPGVDVAAFAPRGAEAAREGLRALARRLETPGAAPARAAAAPAPAAAPPTSAFARDQAAAARALARVDPDRDRIVVFVGKLIASKGVELLMAAWPLVVADHPDATLVVVGFGAFREGLEGLARDLAAGDLGAAAALRAEDGRELPVLGATRASAAGSRSSSSAWSSRPVHTIRSVSADAAAAR